DLTVTGVQTCALPIWRGTPDMSVALAGAHTQRGGNAIAGRSIRRDDGNINPNAARRSATEGDKGGRRFPRLLCGGRSRSDVAREIGRASCRERVQKSG